MKSLWNRVYTRFLATPIATLKYSCLDLFRKDSLLINFWCPPRSRLGEYNWGDDINMVLPELISGKKVVPYRFSLLASNRPNYLCIGSIVCQLSNPEAIIWGSGVISPDAELTAKPTRVCAVRGPLTRQYLLERGVDCPDIYGDPALLFPLYYTPKITKKYKMGIIPHYHDKRNSLIDRYKSTGDVYVFDIQDYGKWNFFIDRVCECEFILSSSLHGLIIADAYGIPNCWVEFSDLVYGNGFKFKDYFLSIGRTVEEPLSVREFIPVGELITYKEKWHPIQFDTSKLLAACPFLK